MKKSFVLLLTVFNLFIVAYGENNIKNTFLYYEDAYKYYVSILNSNHEIKNESILEKYSDFLPYISYNFSFGGDKISKVDLNTSSINFSWNVFRSDFSDKAQMNKLNKQIATLSEENIKRTIFYILKTYFIMLIIFKII
ncbi:TolC family protein [Marinitoga sp. 38H-ov]|uniref:TolC family protein n=1 Tax=Marinitoga sp. 38H-ov TaxID=1755814 RepID=UPI0013EB6511|nr:TolC family protein [Marinitoga sp. 38H-ov]KAF2955394.1 hypothetical protein AS160_10535 [Marinitoga sp. 38H-ov]